jgi:glycosyltransferase involved in cell wall biosynthesis
MIIKVFISFFVKRLFRFYLNFLTSSYFIKKSNNCKKPKLLFGTTPIINNKYWSKALKETGYCSTTLMKDYYSINKKSDYDLYFGDVINRSKFRLKYFCHEYVVFYYILKNYDIIHIPFYGLNFNDSWIKKNEIKFLKRFNIKIVVLPYGGDFYQYSQIPDISVRHVLLCNYPDAAKREPEIKRKIEDYIINADIIVSGFQVEGLPRWDLFPFNHVIIDAQAITPVKRLKLNDGIDGIVNIVHTPNHKSIKGTEYLVNAVNLLKAEGLLVELLIIEGKTNDEVLQILNFEADVLVEQLIGNAYALSAMEGMACGLPVISNLSNVIYTQAFRRYSYLNECPILSGCPENITEILRIVIKNPNLRQELGAASRKYVEKYHSKSTAQYFFARIYDKIWFNKEVDLMNLFHPLNPVSYNNQSPKIEHPLVDNKIPMELLNKLNR